MRRHSSNAASGRVFSAGGGGEEINEMSSRESDEEVVKNEKADIRHDPSLVVSLGALLILTVFFTTFTVFSFKVMYLRFIDPLPRNAPLDKFSEGRAMDQLVAFAGNDAVGRQEGSPGLDLAAQYIINELKSLKARASPNVMFDIDESYVNGSLNLEILQHSISLTYKNHSNIAARIAAKDAPEDAAALVLNAHFDAPLGSPGAADCGSCVVSLLETLRQIIDTAWVPTAPVIFLFNGAEEVFLLATHGFVTTHKWRDSLGAIINVEASGACGPDLVVQSGPGSWPSRVYYESAVHPMGNSVAQDIFPHVPGDTDYRIFAQDFGDIPGLDTVLLLKGSLYHTGYDKPEFIVPGALQARGDNLVALVKGFTSAPELKGSVERAAEKEAMKGRRPERRAVFFDVWGKWMIYYSHRVASALHLLPLAIVFLAPSLASSELGFQTVGAKVQLLLQGLMVHVLGIILAVLFPILLAIMRLSVASTAMTWFAQIWITIFFVPCSIAGLLIPRIIWTRSKRNAGLEQEAVEWAGHWGVVAYNALLSAIITLSGGAGYLEFLWAIVLIPAYSIFRFCQNVFGKQSLLAMVGYLIPASLPTAYTLYFGGMLIQFIAEKTGISGSNPPPIGFYVADVIMATLLGAAVASALGPLIPIVARWVATPQLVRLLLYSSIGAAALSSRAFPYAYESPKRLILQHTIHTTGGSEVAKSSYDFASIDPNPVTFIWKHAPAVVKSLNLSKAQLAEDIAFHPTTFMALYPISRMIGRGTRSWVGESSNLSRQYPVLEVVGEYKDDTSTDTQKRRIHVEVDLGDLGAIWGTVMNITGPLVSWSFADQKLPAPEAYPGGPPSYICRLSSHTLKERWQFWLEASNATPLRIELAVLDQKLEKRVEELAASFPAWVAVVTGTSYLSTYTV